MKHSSNIIALPGDDIRLSSEDFYWGGSQFFKSMYKQFDIDYFQSIINDTKLIKIKYN